MASVKSTTKTPKVKPSKPEPLIPECNKYVYRPGPMNKAAQDVVRSARAKKVKIVLPTTPHSTVKLVHALCSAAEAGHWSLECENALEHGLPVREHHKAFLSHNMFVTMIGAMVARALEQATRGCEKTLDLLANRYYVRSITCHDSSKTSTMEAAAYSGIMAIHMEKEALVANAKLRKQMYKRNGVEKSEEEMKASTLDKLYVDSDAVLTAMADFGFKHHYKNNAHHPEHFCGKEMDDFFLVEAIVDGLACIFERNKHHRDVDSWLKMYHVDRFPGRNKDFAQKILDALKLYISEADYKALEAFRASVFSIVGESIPWSYVRCSCDKEEEEENEEKEEEEKEEKEEEEKEENERSKERRGDRYGGKSEEDIHGHNFMSYFFKS